MDNQRMVRVSKFLSRHLRHAPQDIGLTLEEGAWVTVEALLDGCARAGMKVSRDELHFVVANSDKKRFAFDDSGARIRANQGHSVEVDLQLAEAVPPDVLYHGTAAHNRDPIMRSGLMKMKRHHVHLSATVDTAHRVGARHGKPLVLVVDARSMHAAGVTFFCSDNGVWLVDAVPPQYLRVL